MKKQVKKTKKGNLNKQNNKKLFKKYKSLKNISVHIFSSYNNTIINFTDSEGNTILWKSAGVLGYKGSKKSSPYAATKCISLCLEELKELNIKELNVYLKGIGPGRFSIIKALQQNNDITIKQVIDKTPIPFNGCRLKKKLRKRKK